MKIRGEGPQKKREGGRGFRETAGEKDCACRQTRAPSELTGRESGATEAHEERDESLRRERKGEKKGGV